MNLSTITLLGQAQGAEGTGLWGLFLEASPVAYLILSILVLMSIGSWTITIGKLFQLKKARSQSAEFLEIFRGSKRFSEVSSASEDLGASPLVGVFQAGYIEIDGQVKAMRNVSEDRSRYMIKSMSSVERTLRRAAAVEQQELTRHLHFLATTAAASPFIGLLGTVVGIMVSFNDIGRTGSTSIIAVAPGIAEALINTAAGLGAAIPALVAYNILTARIRVLRDEMQDFVLEFMNLAERNFT